MRSTPSVLPLADHERTIKLLVRPLSDTDLALAFRYLSVLLDGGLSLVGALADIARIDPRARLHQRWSAVASQVEQGHSLSSAVQILGLTRHSDVIATLAAAEIDGSLAQACSALERSLRARAEHRRRLRMALIYPAFAGVSLIFASGFLLLRVVPTLTTIAPGEQTLPAHAIPLLWLSEVLQGGSMVHVLLPLLLATSVAVLLRRWFPVFGTGNPFELAAYSRIVCRLRIHGSTLVDAMRVAEDVISSSRLRAELVQARYSVVVGRRLAQSLSAARHIPPLVVSLVSVGENSGSLDASLERAAQVLEDDARHRLERMELIAPHIMLAVVGGLLLWIVVSIVLPLYDRALTGGLAGAMGT